MPYWARYGASAFIWLRLYRPSPEINENQGDGNDDDADNDSDKVNDDYAFFYIFSSLHLRQSFFLNPLQSPLYRSPPSSEANLLLF